MSRSRRDWDNDRRDRIGQATVREIAQEHALDDDPPKSFADVARGEKLKGTIRVKVGSNKPNPRLGHVTKQAYAIEKILHEARIHVLASEAQDSGVLRCICQMKIEYSFGHLHQDVVAFVREALGATSTQSSYDLVFPLECPRSVFGDK